MNVVDLFAGPGGWDSAAQQLGLDPLGIEQDAAACATRKAAGLRTLQADVSELDPADFQADGLIASPPCQDFSLAGKRAGIDGERGQLVREVPRWVKALRPSWVACEQVPPVLPIWQEYAHLLRSWGYSTWCGVVNAADYGVPQTRQRAILLARLGGSVLPPEPTHCKGGAPESMFGPGLEPWVSMAEALGWNEATALRHPRGEGMVERHGPRADKPADQESMTLHTNRDQQPDGSRQTVPCNEPAPSFTAKSGGQWQLRNGNQPNACIRPFHGPAGGTMFFGHRMNEVAWVNERPATTVQGDPRIGRPGHKDRDKGEAQFEQESVRITVQEAAILQSFPPDYPWQGSRTKQFEQCGNAIPPRLALHLLSAVTGIALPGQVAA